ncbi:MAG: carbon monoxide dehydrogenase subunit G [Gammaproteobacteria bacterium]|nr:carbon monoxide dehydrogenase subunit G [Gammaproteobacteria bacterium]MBU1352286.1 carbon monoxide dehydrogenase subunit G [Gammaproteobacteria bacterium]MBU1508159.1 carbon monoxide dehydrogenase subunit G [Gammaproteobacteria bacterium]MBU1818024.1 carbon monoxide dehydrogenase subunit G [Gammaproteobacteria bacterium]MBU2120722.1 carbon monoxide dehydrogenase subunit G [Gammaproteobacteria bacterium]
MEMQASRTLAVSQQQAWEALNDPEVLKLCIPGCDKVEPTGENQYAVAMALKIGPVSAKFAGKITLSEIVPPESYTIAFDGSGGVAGFGKGNAQVKLVALPADAAGQESCELHYTVHATVGGKIAQLGQRLIDGAAKSMAEDFFKRFDHEMQRRHPRAQVAESAHGPDTVPAEEPTQPGALTALAASAGENNPPSGIPVWVWVAGAAALVVLAWVIN